MSDAKLRSVCATMKHFIDMTRTELVQLQDRIELTEQRLREARAERPTNVERVAALEDRLTDLAHDRDNATNALQVLVEEFSAQCHG
jgi:chromosome segregation ATPase